MVKSYEKLSSWYITFPSFLIVHFLFLSSGIYLKSEVACLLNDAWILHSMAVNYIEQGVMSFQDEGPTLFQLPFYPFIISCFYRVFGEDPRYVLGFQICVNAALLSFILTKTKRIMGKWNVILFLFLLFDVHVLLYASCLITEFWIFSFWLLSWFFIACYERTEKVKFWFFHVVCLSIMAWIKPLMGIWVPFSLLISFFFLSKIRFKWRLICLGLTLHMVLLTPLFIRNYQATGEIGRYSTISSFNAWYFNIVYYESKKNNVSIHDTREIYVNKMREHINKTENKNLPVIDWETANDRGRHVQALGLDEYKYAKVADELARDYMKKNFTSYSIHHILSGFKIFTTSNLSWFKQYYNNFETYSFASGGISGNVKVLMQMNFKSYFLAVRVYELIFVFFLILFSSIYLILDWRKIIHSYFLQYGLLFIAYMVAISGVNVWGRFRYLFMPVLIYLGICGLKLVYEKIRFRNKQKA
jgi:hypothetical protein